LGIRRNESGFTSRIEASRTKDKLTYGLGSSIESDTYDPNDLGLLFSNNENNQFAFFNYNQNEQKDWYRSFGIRGFVARRALYKPAVATGNRFSLRGNFVTNNLLAIFGGAFHSPGDKNFFEPQVFDFETFFRQPKRTFSELGISTDYSKKFAIDAIAERGFGQDDIPIDVWNFTLRPRFRFNDKLFTVLEYQNRNRFGNVGFADFVGDDTPLLGVRDRIVNQTELNTEYRFIFSNGEVAPENINFSALNVDAVFRWRFAPGSDLIAVYKKQLSEQQNLIRDDFFNNFDALFNQDQNDALNLKAVIFIDYNRLKKKGKR